MEEKRISHAAISSAAVVSVVMCVALVNVGTHAYYVFLSLLSLTLGFHASWLQVDTVQWGRPTDPDDPTRPLQPAPL